MKQQLMEAIVINKSMGNLMKIVMENSTSLNEKKEIFARFSGVKTIEESDNLYKTISEELKREGKTINVNNERGSCRGTSRNRGSTQETFRGNQKISCREAPMFSPIRNG